MTHSDGVGQVATRIRDLLTSALAGTGSGSFRIEYETYKVGVYRIVLRGMTSWRFYVTREEVLRRQQALRGQRVSNGFDGLLICIESTIVEALTATGFGEFLLEYDDEGNSRSRITIRGTERRSFSVQLDELIRRRDA